MVTFTACFLVVSLKCPLLIVYFVAFTTLKAEGLNQYVSSIRDELSHRVNSPYNTKITTC